VTHASRPDLHGEARRPSAGCTSVAEQLALSLDATPPSVYRQRGVSSLQRLFRAHFPELLSRYVTEFAKRLGKFRLERITKAVERFLGCGDYPLSCVPSRRESCRGVARIKCTNTRCKAESFRLFKNMRDWTHSGLDVHASIRIPATSSRTQEALAPCVVRAPLSVRSLAPGTEASFSPSGQRESMEAAIRKLLSVAL